MDIHNYQKTWAINRACKIRMYLGPWLFWVFQCESTIWGGFFCAWMQGTQLLTVFSMPESTLGQYTTLRAIVFIQLIPGCPEYSCLRTAFLSFVGTTIWSANIKYSSMTDEESLRCSNCWSSPVISGGHECPRNLQTFCIIGSCQVSCLLSIFVTEIVQIQSVSALWKSFSMLMVSSSGTDCKLMRHDKASAWTNYVVLWYCMSKLYSNNIIAQCCSQIAEYTGIPFFFFFFFFFFFDLNIYSNG